MSFLIGVMLSGLSGVLVYRKTRSYLFAAIALLLALGLTWLVLPVGDQRTVVDVPAEQESSQQQADEHDQGGRNRDVTNLVPDSVDSKLREFQSGGSTFSVTSPSEKDDASSSGPEDLTLASLQPFRPIEQTTLGYVGSDVCRECHKEEHSSWSHSYHRTMTQVATPEAVLGDFDNVTVDSDGRRFVLSKKGDVCFVDMPDEHDPSKRVKAPVVMTTGSHHMQVYWFASGQKRLLGMLPLVHLNGANEWIPRESAFLVPPNTPPSFELGRWNEACSSCHSTHRKGRRLASGEWDTHVGEFGISCEACHGPAESHVAFRRLPASKSGNAANGAAVDPIVNPAELSKVLSAQVCGQCHSVSDLLHPNIDTMEHGHGYRPGKDLTDTHGVWTRDSPEFERTKESLGYDSLDELLDETFYSDGVIRVSGREYSGMTQSSCYLNGEMTCLSCHKMHKESSDSRSVKQWADDQLGVDSLGDGACLQCHQASQYDERHTHHPAGSTGASCYNCHMPHTAYGLLKAIRNHQISSPNIGVDHVAKRPNACNQCHLDKTLEWSAEHLQDWYQIEPPELGTNEKQIAASLLWLLKGNAAERAIAAWCMGWSDAKATSADNWQVPFLAASLDDDYDAVRLIARRSLQSYSGMEDFKIDVVTSTNSQQRLEAAMKVIQEWSGKANWDKSRHELLLDKVNGVQVDRIKQLIDQRDNSRILLSE